MTEEEIHELAEKIVLLLHPERWEEVRKKKQEESK